MEDVIATAPTLGAFLDALAARDPGREAVAYAPREAVTARLGWGDLRAASRDNYTPGSRSNDVGFRCARGAS